jgi:hypothetical protein
MITAPDNATVIPVNPARRSDQSARLRVWQQGSGGVIEFFMVGRNGGERLESVGMTDGMRRNLITALGGTP